MSINTFIFPQNIFVTLRSKIMSVFLAAMSSSRSDDVTRSVCLSVQSLFVKFAAFKAFEARCLCLRELQCCLRSVCWKFQGCFKEVSRMFQGSLKDVSRMPQGCFKSVSKKFQWGKFQGCSIEGSFQEN